ncbi:hypothetical protein TNCT_334391 [Trichonephila clavata]|uniref:Uncharacterized protein n=1 Tax=Trichonephila clavata TaxID=2740835 RepID=A0A8X6F9Z9_TRICU|nr:hypothetical protein TNCT_334391 [Trichonephila clavata]
MKNCRAKRPQDRRTLFSRFPGLDGQEDLSAILVIAGVSALNGRIDYCTRLLDRNNRRKKADNISGATAWQAWTDL